MLNKWRIGAVLLVMCFYSSGTVAATEKQKDREHLTTHLSSPEKELFAANDIDLDNDDDIKKLPIELKNEISDESRIIDIISHGKGNFAHFAALTDYGTVFAWGMAETNADLFLKVLR
jgi:hypothetical protein